MTSPVISRGTGVTPRGTAISKRCIVERGAGDSPAESSIDFPALGGIVSIEGAGPGAEGLIASAADLIRDLHDRLTRFDSGSELSRLNSDSRRSVPSSPIMVRFAEAVGYAGLMSGGLVDATLIGAIERAGYADSIEPRALAGGEPFRPGPEGPARRPAGADPELRWRSVGVDPARTAVVRPPGVRLDSGGIGKGLAADVVAERLEHLDRFSVSCVGDLRVGGTGGIEREIQIASPWAGEPPVAAMRIARGAVATSGITNRTWTDTEGRPAHHLIDPKSGLPAFTGITQATALAPTAVEAEVRAKAALLSGPDSGTGWLVHGGAIVLESGHTIAVGDRVETHGAGARGPSS